MHEIIQIANMNTSIRNTVIRMLSKWEMFDNFDNGNDAWSCKIVCGLLKLEL